MLQGPIVTVVAYSRAGATKTLGFLRRNLSLAPKETKVAAYKVLVCPQLKYAAPFWNPHHQTDINRIEKLQRTAACWTCSAVYILFWSFEISENILRNQK